MSDPLRVVQWSSGGVGVIAVRVFGEHPDFSLEGVWVRDPEKEGRDSGSLSGLAENGVLTTRDRSALIALSPDCICYSASGESRPGEGAVHASPRPDLPDDRARGASSRGRAGRAALRRERTRPRRAPIGVFRRDRRPGGAPLVPRRNAGDRRLGPRLRG